MIKTKRLTYLKQNHEIVKKITLALVDRKQFWKVFHKTKKKQNTILTSQNFNNFKKLDFLSEINIKAD